MFADRNFLEWLSTQIVELGFEDHHAHILSVWASIALIILLAALSYWIARQYLVSGLTYVVKKTDNKWDDIILDRGVFNRLAKFAPAIVVHVLSFEVFHELAPDLVAWVQRAALVYMILVAVLFLDAFMNALVDINRKYDLSRQRPIRGYVQAVKVFVALVAAIAAISVVINKSPFLLLSGLGALTAVILLVFKDTILGFVASIQLTGNSMIHVGDWISMPKYGADGNVIDITLTTVKVQNWDKTISMIPIYALISDSFVNWRGMSESGGRRIKRALLLDMTSISFLSPEERAKLKNIRLLRAYLEKKDSELESDLKERGEKAQGVNTRRLTNIGTFRAYALEYLKSHPMIGKVDDGLMVMVRQLEPGQNGLPLEVYCFSTDKAWVNYEGIQADIFDHLIAILPEFGLRVFQSPSGHDFRALANKA
jgi:miniconductance mechanosensitive channel